MGGQSLYICTSKTTNHFDNAKLQKKIIQLVEKLP